MAKRPTMQIWIEHNPQTGSARPFEVWGQIEDGKAKVWASAKTQEGSEKSLHGFVKANAEFYDVQRK